MDIDTAKDLMGSYWRTKIMLIVICLIALIAGVSSRFMWGDDNLIEQIAEEVIEQELHLPEGAIDLSPK